MVQLLEEQLTDLRHRYGMHDYNLLSELQINLLLDHSVKNNTHNGTHTVEVINISASQGRTLLELVDILEYLFRENSPGNWGYAHQRLPDYIGVLKTSETPEHMKNTESPRQIYSFKLEDSFCVNVEYRVQKDRA